MKMRSVLFGAVIAVFLAGCPAQKQEPPTVIKAYPIDSLDSVITREGVEFDPTVSSDGNGSLKITAAEPATVRLFETGPLEIDNARLLYQAKMRSENLEGKAYLEMWVNIAGMGEFFSRGLNSPVTGATEWNSQETPFFLKKGQKPDNVKLNLVIDGRGMVWIDDLKLLKAPR